MSVLAAFKQPMARSLWLGLSLAAIGDEVANVAVTWIASGLLGDRIGLVSLARGITTLLTVLVLHRTFTCGSNRRDLLVCDVSRAATCLAVSALAVGQVGLDTPVLMAFVVIMAFFRSVSDPTFAAMIPSLFRHPDLRQVINGLFDSTRRTARVFGPTIAVVASSFLAPSHFFLFQAIGFIASALCIRRLPDFAVSSPPRTADFTPTSLLRSRDYAYVFLSQAINNGVWVLVFSLAAVIYFRERHDGLAGFSSFILCYGIGNVLASVAAASVPIRHPMPWIAMGRIVTGVGTMSLFLSEGTATVYASAVLAAVGTPFADLAFLQKIQSGNPSSSDIKAAVRLKMLSEWSGFILVSAASSWALGSAGFGTIGLIAGGLLVATGAVGLCCRDQ